MIRDTGHHRWRLTLERQVLAPEIVVHEVERHRAFQVLQFLGEGVGEPRESAHAHARGEVLALRIAVGDVLLFGMTDDAMRCCARAASRAVPLLTVAVALVQLDELAVIDPEGTPHGVQMNPVAVCGELNWVGQTPPPDRAYCESKMGVDYGYLP